MILKIIIAIIILGLIYLMLVYIETNTKINFHEKLYPDLYKLPAIISSNMDEQYKQSVLKGLSIAKQSNVVICCLARNNKNVFEKTKQRLEYIGNCFQQYKIVIFENDSNDNTRELISQWSNNNPNVILLDCCQMNSCECKLKKELSYSLKLQKRIKNMSIYREQYLNYVQKNYNNYDYMLVIDFDLDGSMNIDGLYNCLSYDNWDAMFINGRSSVLGLFGIITTPYDSLAYVNINGDYNDTTMPKSALNMHIDTYRYNLFPVKSAFNGYGLYKIKSIINCSYNGNLICEHINLAKSMYDKKMKLYINSLWKGYFNHQGGPNTFFQSIFNK